MYGEHYIGRKNGLRVLDFRGGASRNFFADAGNLKTLSEAKGVKSLHVNGRTSADVGEGLLKQCEAGKEYYLSVGRHASIVRKTKDGKLQYLELQDEDFSHAIGTLQQNQYFIYEYS